MAASLIGQTGRVCSLSLDGLWSLALETGEVRRVTRGIAPMRQGGSGAFAHHTLMCPSAGVVQPAPLHTLGRISAHRCWTSRKRNRSLERLLTTSSCTSTRHGGVPSVCNTSGTRASTRTIIRMLDAPSPSATEPGSAPIGARRTLARSTRRDARWDCVVPIPTARRSSCTTRSISRP